MNSTNVSAFNMSLDLMMNCPILPLILYFHDWHKINEYLYISSGGRVYFGEGGLNFLLKDVLIFLSEVAARQEQLNVNFRTPNEYDASIMLIKHCTHFDEYFSLNVGVVVVVGEFQPMDGIVGRVGVKLIEGSIMNKMRDTLHTLGLRKCALAVSSYQIVKYALLFLLVQAQPFNVALFFYIQSIFIIILILYCAQWFCGGIQGLLNLIDSLHNADVLISARLVIMVGIVAQINGISQLSSKSIHTLSPFANLLSISEQQNHLVDKCQFLVFNMGALVRVCVIQAVVLCFN